MEQKQLLQKALDTWGAEAQIDMAIEECAELIVALQHYKRGRDHNIPEEVADVSICLDELRLMFTGDDVIREQKLQRVEERLKRNDINFNE